MGQPEVRSRAIRPSPHPGAPRSLGVVEELSLAPRGRLVLIEDEDAIVRPLMPALAREGFEVRRFSRAEDAIDRLDSLRPDAVILDVGLPGMSGFRACAAIRRRSRVPVLMLTARGSESDRLAGFEAGADDYLPKPFSVHELVARTRAILRRTQNADARAGGPTVDVIEVGDLRMDAARREVRAGHRQVALTPKEFDLLEFLMRRSPQAVPRAELIREVWDAHWSGPTKTLDVHVAQVRRKIEDDPHDPRYLHTVRGVGYQVRDRCAGD
jgi:two-component system, OmpR family, response regulator RegX3